MKLPVPSDGKWSYAYQALLNATIETFFSRVRTLGDVELQRDSTQGVDRDERLILRSPNGTRYALYVNDYGEVKTASPDTGVQTVVRRWDDLRFPAQSIDPAGSVAPASRDNTDATLIFAGNVNNIIAGIGQMPHAWEDGRPIRPHVHLQFKTAASGVNTRWKLEWDIAAVSGNFGVLTGSDTITVANANNNVKHVIASFAEVATTGMKDSAIVKWKLSRLAQSDAADNDTNACNLLEFDIHYETDNPGGSIDEYPS